MLNFNTDLKEFLNKENHSKIEIIKFMISTFNGVNQSIENTALNHGLHGQRDKNKALIELGYSIHDSIQEVLRDELKDCKKSNSGLPHCFMVTEKVNK